MWQVACCGVVMYETITLISMLHDGVLPDAWALQAWVESNANILLLASPRDERLQGLSSSYLEQ